MPKKSRSSTNCDDVDIHDIELLSWFDENKEILLYAGKTYPAYRLARNGYLKSKGDVMPEFKMYIRTRKGTIAMNKLRFIRDL